MPSQQAETLETIHALKRALRREKEAATTQPITSATNRGNKLQKGASYVHAGALPYPRGPGGHKQRIEHAGYTRYILERNPRRYNEYGDELEDSESDAEADADAEEENPYSGVQIEDLLGPLKHPSELATHPTLSVPFLDSALPDMVQTTETRLRQERANLWRAKQLHRQLIGDESWMPLAAVETQDDWDLFEPKPKEVDRRSKKRKRDEVVDTADGYQTTNGTVPSANEEESKDTAPKEISDAQPHPQTQPDADATSDANMQDQGPESESIPEPTTNGVHNHNHTGNPDESTHDKPKHEDPSQPNSASSTPPPPRRITRALAAEAQPTPTSPALSFISSDLLQPDPIFLLPHPHHASNNFANLLPAPERTETRRLLTMYIQKQEESVRCTEAVIGKLIKALRMRDTVLEWCKAEGHVGEWSDGEDWIDAEAWGEREVDLRKGRDEDDPNAGNGDEDAGGGSVVGIGGKKKRRRAVRGEARLAVGVGVGGE